MGKFILLAKQGCYTFYFTANNGDRIAESPPHITRSAAQRALSEARQCSISTHLYEQMDEADQYYFLLKNETGNVLMTSEKFACPETRDYASGLMRKEAVIADFSETM